MKLNVTYFTHRILFVMDTGRREILAVRNESIEIIVIGYNFTVRTLTLNRKVKPRIYWHADER